jgi:mono/diheme cytochrome c family protein
LKRLAWVLALVTTATASPGLAQDEALGRSLLKVYCSGCHSIERAGDSPHEGAPPFRTLYQKYDVEFLSEALVEGLVTGHPDMPEFAFDPQEAAAIVAYIKSLTK